MMWHVRDRTSIIILINESDLLHILMDMCFPVIGDKGLIINCDEAETNYEFSRNKFRVPF